MPMKARTFSLMMLSALAVICAGCGPVDQADASDERAEIIASRAPGVDYLVMFSNRPSFLINGDLPADRISVIGARLRRLGCSDPRMLRERAQKREGTWMFGRPKVVYYSEWVCR